MPRPVLHTLFWLLMGLSLFVWVLERIGWSVFTTAFTALGLAIFWVFAVGIVRYGLYTWPWWRALSRLLAAPSKPPFLATMGIKIAGDAVSAVNPAHFVVGDPVRVYLLGIVAPRLTSGVRGTSVVLDRAINIVSGFFLMALASALILMAGEIPGRLRPFLWVLLLVYGLLAVVAVPLLHQPRRLKFAWLKPLGRLPGVTRLLARLRQVEQILLDLHKIDWLILLSLIGSHFLGRLCAIAEIALIACLLGRPLALFEVIVLGLTYIVVNFVFGLIPQGIGILEGSFETITGLFGYGPGLGLSIQLIRRANALFWILVGFLLGKVVLGRGLWQAISGKPLTSH